ncbi:MAG: glycosyltransferase family 2 protein [Burkholderiaceae bacterium]|nr:glycosyltransferase family 2 protein [Burkholderiaceae bacterium]
MNLVHKTAAPALDPLSGEREAVVSVTTPQRQGLGVIVLTFNSANVIERTLRAALQVSDTVFVVDSGSSDDTGAIATRLGCQLAHRPFKHYADQRNWAIDEFGQRSEWQLHLDADEVLDDTAIAEIRRVLSAPNGACGFIFRRRTYFLGRPLRFGGNDNFHLRLFKTGTARCEDRLYDQHFVSDRPGVRIGGVLHDMNVGSLTEWTARHNRWSDMEAAELLRPDGDNAGQIKARLSNDPRERRRLYKSHYYKAPPILRAVLMFLYRYVLQGGFLDGRAGFFYAFFQVLWFRMLVDAKLHEKRI